MVTVNDVDAHKLIRKAAAKLEGVLPAAPAWVGRVKSGSHRQRLPQDAKFWFMRCAALLRKTYVDQTVGVSRMRRHFGGRVKRGVRPEHHRAAGGSMIRKGFQALEKAGLIAKKKVGRSITPKGQQFLDSVAREVGSK